MIPVSRSNIVFFADTACREVTFGHKLKMFVFNHGTDALCLQGLTVDVTGSGGKTDMYTCKLADDADFKKTFTYGNNVLSAIPLSCTSNLYKNL